jgi:adenylate cyclase
MPFKIINDAGGQAYELPEGQTLVVGRASTSDIPVFDPTISRRHAEITASATSVNVKDVGSSNGTFINSAQVTEGAVNDGDIVMFGKVSFRIAFIAPVAAPPPPRANTAAPQRASGVAARPSSTILRELDVAKSEGPLSVIFRATSLAEVKADSAQASVADRTAKRLALLLEVSKGLSRVADAEALLDRITSTVFEIMDVDRVAIDLVDANGERVSKISRDRKGVVSGKAIPQTIARKVAGEKVAVLSDNAAEDERFGGQSIVMQSVRSAMCAPLIGSGDVVLGVLYVDNVTAIQKFGDEDLDFLIAFSNIAAVALENSRFAERIRRETIVRSNFERFFAPTLAARIAGAGEQVKLGGEKRTIAILFSDIRGFTSLSETMNPDDVANLLSEYFTVMVEIVFRHGGTLDKFIGDAVMAQWGAPIGEKDDADRAMAAAIDMLEELKILNVKWKAAGRPEMQIGIGLNYGESFAGYIGSERRLEYTVIGDAVNISSRLCARAEGGEILLTESVKTALSKPPAMTEKGSMELKGRKKPMPVFSIVP